MQQFYWFFFFLSFKAQGTDGPTLGKTRDEVFRNLLLLGNIYRLHRYGTDFTETNQIHTVLSKVYGGIYPLKQIMDEVILTWCTLFALFVLQK